MRQEWGFTLDQYAPVHISTFNHHQQKFYCGYCCVVGGTATGKI